MEKIEGKIGNYILTVITRNKFSYDFLFMGLIKTPHMYQREIRSLEGKSVSIFARNHLK